MRGGAEGRWIVAFAIATTCACSTPAPEADSDDARLVERSHDSMGAAAHLTAWTNDAPGAEDAFKAVFTELERIESLMSTWRPGSDIVRLNDAAGMHPVAVSPEVLEALGAAIRAGEMTNGAFDVTFGALSGIWKFDHDQDNRIPPRSEIQARLPLIDYRNLKINAAQRTAFLTRPGMRAHLGGIGKGYAIDRAASLLRSRGVHHFMIQFGGDLYVAGRRGDRAWRLGIRHPRGPADRAFAAIDLTDSAFSTSGDYERFFERDGRRYHHIIDPRTGEPTRGTRSVTIVTPTATLADVLSTGVFVLGPAAGMALIEKLPDVEGVIVDDESRVIVSTGIRDRLVTVTEIVK